MDESLINLIYKITAIILFISSMSIFIIIYNQTNSTVKLINEKVQSGKEVSKTKTPIEQDIEFVEGEMIMSSIYHGLEIPIEVDGVLIENVANDENFFSPGSLAMTTIDLNSQYEENLIIDDDGNVTKVIYIKK